MAVPALSAEQRRAASRKAVAARQRRAQVSAELKSGAISVREVLGLADGDDAVAGMRASDLIASLPRFGPRRAHEAMSTLRIAATRRVRGLGATQRQAIITLAESRQRSGPRT